MSFKRLKLGKTGEEIAATFLSDKGYKIISKNYRTKAGEIDIIARIKTVLVFVEVKTRKSSFLESPLAAVTKKKQTQISMVAQQYLQKYKLFDREARFDVISIFVDTSRNITIDHIKNAFDLSYGF